MLINPFEKFLLGKMLAYLTDKNSVVPDGYIQLVEDIKDGKIGDGVTPFNSLPYFRIEKKER